MKGYEKAAQAIQSVKQVIIGKDDCVLAIMEAILANGHILIEYSGRGQDEHGACVCEGFGYEAEPCAVYT